MNTTQWRVFIIRAINNQHEHPDFCRLFEHAKHIYAIAERFTDATGVLEDLCSAICDRDYSRSKLLQDVAFVKKFIIPLLKESIKTITTAATVLSPLARVKYVHERNENKRKREVAMSKNLK